MVFNDENDDNDSDSVSDLSDDTDDGDGEGETRQITINANSDIVDINNLVEELQTETESVSELPGNLKKLTVSALKELVLERFPDLSEQVPKMKKKELINKLSE